MQPNFSSGFKTWYQTKRPRQRYFWGFLAFCISYPVGRIFRVFRTWRADFGDHMVITEYNIEKKNSSEFEKLWNQQARITQTYDGYLGTKLFKVLDRDWPEQDEFNEKIENIKKTQTQMLNVNMETATEVKKDTRLPFQYLQLRGWRTPDAENKWKEDKRIQELLKQIELVCVSVTNTEYSTIVDDKIKRTIF